MKSGHISVKAVLEYARNHPYPATPSRKEYKSTYNGYKAVFQPLLQQIPQIPGWYAWVKIEKGQLELIYIGKSSKGKTSNVWARVDEEFRDERIVFWATVHEHHRNAEPKGKYATGTKRYLRKVGITHILWLVQAGLNEKRVKTVECNLIRRYNPPANIQKGKCTDSHTELTNKAIEEFESVMEQVQRTVI